MFCGAHYKTGHAVLLVFFVKKEEEETGLCFFDALCWGKKPGQLQALVNSWHVCEGCLTGTQAKSLVLLV